MMSTDMIHRLRTLYPTHPVVMQAAAKIETQSRVLTEIAGSMAHKWTDPAEHANWCVEQAQSVITP
jgi:hypothetical protein